jgi:Holliday junction resolvasome RuvABC endonuclease subunit
MNMSALKLLALDVSSKIIGWSILNDKEKLLAFGFIDLQKFKKKKFPLEYMCVAYKGITDIIVQHQPTTCIIEATFYRNAITLKSLAKMRGVAEIACLHNGLTDIVEVHASTARKYLFKNGKIEKEAIYNILRKKYSDAIYNEGYDISDSIVVGLYGVKTIKKVTA